MSLEYGKYDFFKTIDKFFEKLYLFAFRFYKNYGVGKSEVTGNNMHGNIY